MFGFVVGIVFVKFAMILAGLLSAAVAGTATWIAAHSDENLPRG